MMNTIRQINNIFRNSSPVAFLMLLLYLVFSSITSFSQANPSVKFSTVIIDAGHGGKDPGAVVGKAREKEIVLDIALRLGNMIKKELPDVKVIYTRNGDYFVPLFKRSEIANKSNANLFISIHANFCSSPSVKGTETYVLGLHRTQDNLDVAKKENSVILLEDDYTQRYEGFDPNLPESYIMFELIQDNHIEHSVMFAGMVQDLFREHAHRPDRDVRQAGFLVLRETAMPSVLIETGYLSNKTEADYLMTSNGRETIASSIFRSLKNYKSKMDSRILASADTRIKKEDSIKKEITEDKTKPQPAPKSTEKVEVKKVVSVQSTEEVKNVEKQPVGIAKQPNEQFAYAIQIAASKTKLPKTLKMFNGIKDIKEIRIAGYYKYYCHETQSRVKIGQDLSVIKKRIPDAFIVGMKNGLPVPVTELPPAR